MLTPPLTKSTDQKPDSAREAAVDAELVRRFNQGDEAAFLRIMERYQSKIYAAVICLLHNHADAEEVTQDTLIRAHRGLARFRGDASLATWLYRIAVNLARNRHWYYFRRRRQDTLSLDHSLADENEGTFADLIAAASPDPAQETAAGEFTGLIASAMAKLDRQQREILIMRNVANLSYQEIAQSLRINVGTVKSRIARARENLRQLMAAECPEFSPETSLGDYFIPARPLYGRPAVACA